MRKRTAFLALALTACLSASCTVATHRNILAPATYHVKTPTSAPTMPEGVTGATTCPLYRAQDGRIYTQTWIAVEDADFDFFPVFFIESGSSYSCKRPCQFRWVRLSQSQDYYRIDELCDKPEGPLTRIGSVKLGDLRGSWITKPSIKWREPLAMVDHIVVDLPLTIAATVVTAPFIAIYHGVLYIITGSGPIWPC